MEWSCLGPLLKVLAFKGEGQKIEDNFKMHGGVTSEYFTYKKKVIDKFLVCGKGN